MNKNKITMYLSHDINGTHEYLINVSVFHKLCHMHQCMLKACPHPANEMGCT